MSRVQELKDKFGLEHYKYRQLCEEILESTRCECNWRKAYTCDMCRIKFKMHQLDQIESFKQVMVEQIKQKV